MTIHIDKKSSDFESAKIENLKQFGVRSSSSWDPSQKAFLPLKLEETAGRSKRLIFFLKTVLKTENDPTCKTISIALSVFNIDSKKIEI